jgi:hypothetical protein
MYRGRTRFAWLPALAVLLVGSPQAWAWNGPDHAMATQVAVSGLPDTVPAFVREGGGLMAHCSKDPDLFKKPVGGDDLTQTETPEHYIDLERLGGDEPPATRFDMLAWALHHNMTPAQIGLCPYAIIEWTERLTVAFAEHRRWPDDPDVRTKALVYAGLLAHYAEDICQPLHTTVDFNGRARPDGSSPQTGIHLKVDDLLHKLPPNLHVRLDPATIKPFGDLRRGVWATVRSSHALVERVYALERDLPGYGQPIVADSAVGEFAKERLQASAGFTAQLILTAWVDSAQVRMPKWHERPASALPVYQWQERATSAWPASAAKPRPAAAPATSATAPVGASQAPKIGPGS